MRADADTATGAIVHEDAMIDEPIVRGLRVWKVDADPAGAFARVERRVDLQAALERHLRDPRGQAHVVLANLPHAHAFDQIVSGLGDHVAGNGRRAGTPPVHRTIPRHRCGFECEGPSVRHPAGDCRFERFAQRRLHVNPAAAGAAAEPFVTAAGNDIEIPLDHVVRIDAGRLICVDAEQGPRLAAMRLNGANVAERARDVVRVRENRDDGPLGDGCDDTLGRNRAAVV